MDHQAYKEVHYHEYCKKFGEFNLDATLSLTNLILGYNPERALDLYAFAGPTMNFAKAVNTNITISQNGGSTTTWTEDGTKTRIGATAGLGLAYNLNNKWALNLEGRFGVTPSIFGDASDCRKAEATGRLTLGFAYTFGGKKFAKVEDRIIEKVVEKEIKQEEVKKVEEKKTFTKKIAKTPIKIVKKAPRVMTAEERLKESFLNRAKCI